MTGNYGAKTFLVLRWLSRNASKPSSAEVMRVSFTQRDVPVSSVHPVKPEHAIITTGKR